MSEHVIDFRSSDDHGHFRRALGRFATGVTIVTTRTADGKLEGLTANSFSSVSLDPPLVLWSLRKQAPSLASFTSAGHFAVNVLGTHQKHLCRHFATPHADKFGSVAHRIGDHGAPLIEDTIARFECRTEQVIEAGDHLIFLGRVLRAAHRDGEPLIYATGALCGPALLPADPPANDLSSKDISANRERAS
ncbi:flavin reductase family protein [Ancylobacter oerskovii]|uniref:Flavin reductase family protein n=1 Tax=Ancylobacter oerskovii TaxID=459519 RepID=A0ABW4YXQ6_9HYPH|nr:flavin reductase family protein [Ancylobacter oerskovii]MBS7541887.1 flavin reductase family protein [Ancylobacter oerskovii]